MTPIPIAEVISDQSKYISPCVVYGVRYIRTVRFLALETVEFGNLLSYVGAPAAARSSKTSGEGVFILTRLQE